MNKPDNVHSAMGEIMGRCQILKRWVRKGNMDDALKLIDAISDTADAASDLATKEARQLRESADRRYDRLMDRILK